MCSFQSVLDAVASPFGTLKGTCHSSWPVPNDVGEFQGQVVAGSRFELEILGACLGGRLWRFCLIRCDSKGLDLQPFVHVEALLAIETLHKVSRSLTNRSSDAAGIDFYRPALGICLAIFVSQCDVVGVQSDLPYWSLFAGWVCQFSLTHFLDGFSAGFPSTSNHHFSSNPGSCYLPAQAPSRIAPSIAPAHAPFAPHTAPTIEGVAVVLRQFLVTTAVISASMKVNVTIGPSWTFSTKGGRKQAIQTPSLCRTVGYTIPAEPLVNSLSPSVWETM